MIERFLVSVFCGLFLSASPAQAEWYYFSIPAKYGNSAGVTAVAKAQGWVSRISFVCRDREGMQVHVETNEARSKALPSDRQHTLHVEVDGNETPLLSMREIKPDMPRRVAFLIAERSTKLAWSIIEQIEKAQRSILMKISDSPVFRLEVHESTTVLQRLRKGCDEQRSGQPIAEQ